MKQKNQIRYLFTKQVLESESRKSMDGIHLVLKVEKNDGEIYVSDGLNSIELVLVKQNKTQAKRYQYQSTSDLIVGHLYLFGDCNILYKINNEVLNLKLQVAGFNLIMPIFIGVDPKACKLIELDLQEYDHDQIRRKVDL